MATILHSTKIHFIMMVTKTQNDYLYLAQASFYSTEKDRRVPHNKTDVILVVRLGTCLVE